MIACEYLQYKSVTCTGVSGGVGTGTGTGAGIGQNGSSKNNFSGAVCICPSYLLILKYPDTENNLN